MNQANTKLDFMTKAHEKYLDEFPTTRVPIVALMEKFPKLKYLEAEKIITWYYSDRNEVKKC
ncbi:MAG: hypothetical protein ACFFDN_09240 [Candidatus Hodarchaeota archaeon]